MASPKQLLVKASFDRANGLTRRIPFRDIDKVFGFPDLSIAASILQAKSRSMSYEGYLRVTEITCG